MDQDFLADLDDLGDDDYELDEAEEEIGDKQRPNLDENSLEAMTATYTSTNTAQLIEKITVFSAKPRSTFYSSGPIESDPEYQTIVQANALTSELLNEITNVSKRLRDLYKPRFEELESLILNHLDYAKAVKMIQNETDLGTLDLKSFLGSATVMVIIVTSTTTTGTPLSPEVLVEVLKACDLLLDMDALKNRLLSYVQSRMGFLAPNMSVLLGSGCAAKIMGIAGGLTALSKIPGCNVLVLGAEKKGSGIGLSSITSKNHAGYIYEAGLVASAPVHVRRKAARLMSAKCALACRCDLSREYGDGSMGRKFREEVERKISLLVEPPPSKKIKALPLPIEHKKRRGGKRARTAKARMAPSDLQKASGRMAFGEAEIEVGGHLGSMVGLGMIGGSTGKLKLAHKDFKGIRVRFILVPVSRKHKTMSNFAASSNPNSGLASSVAFTPIKGIELENPEIAAQRIKSVNDKYFSASTFKQ